LKGAWGPVGKPISINFGEKFSAGGGGRKNKKSMVKKGENNNPEKYSKGEREGA